MKKLFYPSVLLLTASIFFTACSDNTIYPTSLSFDRTAITLYAGQTTVIIPTITPSNADNQNIWWRSDNPSIATVDVHGEVTAVWGGTTEIIAMTAEGIGEDGLRITARSKVTVNFDLSNSIDGVEIAGIRWATRNLAAPGTFANNLADVGMFFQWNRRQGWAATGDITEWDSSIPSGTEWTIENDPCPTGWRVPTREELQSLRDSGHGWATHNGVTGRVFGVRPNQIFLPAAGWRYGSDGRLGHTYVSGSYWSTITTDAAKINAWALQFNSSRLDESNPARINGFSIRCVRK